MTPEQVISQITLERGATSLHQQIHEALAQCIRDGRLAAGTRLPTVAAMAKLLNVSLVTAARAVQSLRAAGLLDARPGAGTTVAARRGMTELLLRSVRKGASGSTFNPFYGSLLRSVEQAFADEDHVIMASTISGGLMTPQQYVNGLVARGVDSLIAYRPATHAIPLLRLAASRISVVTLINRVEDDRIGCVVPCVHEALTQMVQVRLRAGQRVFATVRAQAGIRLDAMDSTVYGDMMRVYRKVLAEAGVRCFDFQVAEHRVTNFDPIELRLPDGSLLPNDAVVLLETPSMQQRLIESQSDAWDLISYTEYDRTVHQMRHRMSLVYCDSDRIVRAAVDMLRQAQRPSPMASPVPTYKVPAIAMQRVRTGIAGSTNPGEDPLAGSVG